MSIFADKHELIEKLSKIFICSQKDLFKILVQTNKPMLINVPQLDSIFFLNPTNMVSVTGLRRETKFGAVFQLWDLGPHWGQLVHILKYEYVNCATSSFWVCDNYKCFSPSFKCTRKHPKYWKYGTSLSYTYMVMLTKQLQTKVRYGMATLSIQVSGVLNSMLFTPSWHISHLVVFVPYALIIFKVD